MEDWQEWPLLLSLLLPDIRLRSYDIVRVNQSEDFDGLDPIISPRSFLLINNEEGGLSVDFSKDRTKRDWDRRIYAIKHKDRILCGFLEGDARTLTLVPHPAAETTPRRSFQRANTTVLGIVIGAAVPIARSLVVISTAPFVKKNGAPAC